MSQGRPQSHSELKRGADLDLLDRQILNILQSDFPLVERPFELIGDSVGLTEAEDHRAARVPEAP